jgi:uncharacterized protein YukE
MPDGFTMEVGHLRTVGNTMLPKAITNVDDTVSQLKAARKEEAAAFSSSAYRAWQDAAGALHKVLTANRDTLDLGRQAILEIADRYAGDDDQARRRFGK